jgi:AcrR family transcriptional regulator
MTEEVRLNRRQQAKARTRTKMIEAARKLWAEPGSYERVGIREIAAEMGMSTGAVFANIASKADLWREAMGYEPPVDSHAVREFLRAAATYGRRAA